MVMFDKNGVFDTVERVFAREKDMKKYISIEYPNAVEQEDKNSYILVDGSIIQILSVVEQN